ncbi:MAG: peptidase dimerization domain-containing protein [Caldilineaceae bacterium]
MHQSRSQGRGAVGFTVEGEATHTHHSRTWSRMQLLAQRPSSARSAAGARAATNAVTHPIGHSMLTVTQIAGGSGINVVPDRCTIAVDRRVINGEEAQDVATALQRLAEKASPLPVTTHTMLVIDAFYQPLDSPLLVDMQRWSGRVAEVAPYGAMRGPIGMWLRNVSSSAPARLTRHMARKVG